jgi:y4mF family transcriptional regulator
MSKTIPIGNTLTPIASAEALGQLVREVRRARGLTQEDVSFAAGVGRRFIVDLEAGKPTVRLERVLRVLEALGIQLSGATR